MCVLLHLLICTVLRAYIIVVEVLYKLLLLLLKNHKSTTLHSCRTLVEKELKTQIKQGIYVSASKMSATISPLGAIPKDDGSVRLIHDGSLPEGFSMNEYTDHHSVRYQTLLRTPVVWLNQGITVLSWTSNQRIVLCPSTPLTITKPQG